MKSAKYLLIISAALCVIFIAYYLKADDNNSSNISLTTKEIFLSKFEQQIEFHQDIAVSPDNKRIAFIQLEGTGGFAIVNGVRGKVYDRKYFTLVGCTFSPDSKHLAYPAGTNEKKNFVVLDGEEGPGGFSRIGYPVFSPDSRQLSYYTWDSNSKKEIVFLNKEKLGGYERITYLSFSPDGKRLGFVAGEGNKELAIVDGKEGKYYNYVRGFMFSNDSQHYIYKAWNNKKGIIVKDGIEISESNSLETAIFNPDFSRTACIYKEGDKKFVIVDGKSSKQYDNITELKFSPNGQSFAYAAWNISGSGRTMHVVLDGQEQKKYEWVKDITFSPNSERIAYLAGIKGKNEQCIVVDDNEGKKYIQKLGIPNYNVSPPVFSPDSNHVGYIVEMGDKSWIVVDKIEGRHYDKIRKETMSGWYKWDKSFTFGPDGKVAYWAAKKGYGWMVVVDGVESKAYWGYPEDGKIVFEGPNLLSFVAYRDMEMFRVEIEIKQN